MDYDAWKDLPSRKKAIWPASSKGYREPQQMIMISLDADLAAWAVDHLVGQSSFSSDLEETLITALRVIKGDISVDELLALKALGRGRTA